MNGPEKYNVDPATAKRVMSIVKKHGTKSASGPTADIGVPMLAGGPPETDEHGKFVS
jgi:hypothetical protein